MPEEKEKKTSNELNKPTKKKKKHKKKSNAVLHTKSHKRKKHKRKIKRRVIYTALGFAAALLLIAAVYFSIRIVNVVSEKHKQEDNTQEYDEQLVEEQRKAAEEESYRKELAANAKDRIAEAESNQAEWEKMWLAKMDVPKEETSSFAAFESCLISEKNPYVVVASGSIPGIPNADTEDLYLFAIDTFDTGISESDTPVGRFRIDKTSTTFKINADLNYKKSSSLLFKKFVVASKINNQYVMISKPLYITNPEQIAPYSSYKTPASKKGFILDANRLNTGELEDLGIKQCAYNIWLGRLQNTSAGAINYEYNGKTYSYNKSDLAAYDIIFSTLSSKGIQATVILLNDVGGSGVMIHPNAKGGSSSPYYMFNGATEDGVEAMAAAASFLAERYSGKHGTISNWIIANEINARKEWNYYEKTDVDTYSKEYAQGFRVFYNAIKSVNKDARVYMPLDQIWNRNIDSKSGDYDARDVLDSFNRIISEKGNIDWDLAYHPYGFPLTNTAFWSMSSKNRALVTNSADTGVVTMENINVVTNYLCNDSFLNPDGEARKVLLSEQGFSSTKGEALQAAAIAYAYKIAEANSHINGFILNREIDAAAEISQGLALGIMTTGGGHKQSYEVYKYIDTPEANSKTEFALPIIGINDWSQVIHSY